jgi:hypothetical protein
MHLGAITTLYAASIQKARTAKYRWGQIYHRVNPHVKAAAACSAKINLDMTTVTDQPPADKFCQRCRAQTYYQERHR